MDVTTGGSGSKYYDKYIKYKAKYQKLKAELNN